MMRGRPAVYATFASYDEVAHHSGLERADTLEALRKLDQQFARIENARRYAPRPYEIVVLSDHGQTQGATFKQRHGYGLDELVERSLSQGSVAALLRRRRAAGRRRPRGRRGHRQGRQASAQERRLRPRRRRARLGQPRPDLPDGAPTGGSRWRRSRSATPSLIGALREHPHIGWLLVRSAEHGALVLGPTGSRRLEDGARRGRRPAGAVLAHRAGAPAAHRRLRARRRHHGRQLLRPRARGGLRLRGADLLPRRARRPADAAVHPLPADAHAAAGADHRRRGGPRRAARLAARAPGAAAAWFRRPAPLRRPPIHDPAPR